MTDLEQGTRDLLRPLTGAQALLWTGQRLDPDSTHYNMALAFRIEGEIDVEAFRAAFGELVDRCDALRMVFVETSDGPRRRTLEHVDWTLQLEDLSNRHDCEQVLRDELRTRTRQSFRMEGPLFETALFKLAAGRFVWFLNQHHLITDAWSTTVLFERMSELYVAICEGRLDGGPAWRSYEEFADYESRAMNKRQGRRAAAHWLEARKETRRPTLFYGETPDSTGGVAARNRTDRSERHVVPLGRDRSLALRALASQPEFRAITDAQALFQIFSTVLLAFLHRIGGSRMPGFSAPVHNRSSAKLREVLGLLIELFPLSVTLDEDETFVSLAAKTARANQQRLLHAVAGTARLAPSHDVVLNFIKGGFGDFAGLPTESEWVHPGRVDRNHKLRVQVYDFALSGEFLIELDLNEDIFGEQEAKWAIRHLLVMIDALIDDAGQPIASPQLVSFEELESFAPRGRTTTPERTVPARIAEQARRYPDEIAIRDDSRTVSYLELVERAARVAGELRRQGIEPGDRVGVLTKLSADLVVALLGVAEAGGAYVPLDPTYPDDRLDYIANDAGLRFAITTREYRDRAKEWVDNVVCVEDLRTEGEVESFTGNVSADRLAYVLYTSGSTGKPKGVMVSHSSLANYIGWAVRQYTDGERLSFPLFTSPAFDLTVTSIYTPLVSGGCIVVYGNESSRDAFVIRRIIEDDSVDVVKLTPSHLALTRDQDFSRSRIRTLILGGEDLPTELAAAVHDASGGRLSIFNEYGPTEATVGCMIHRYDRDRDRSNSVPIGVPADNVRIHVLDPDMRPVPRGVAGEIVIGGSAVTRGYLGLEEESRKAFVPDPFDPPTIAYRSGDRGRWNRNGVLEFLGRLDSQVKWRGARIELGEVEVVLASHPAIRQCAATLVEPRARPVVPRRCARCGLEENHPEAQLDEEDICAVCHRFEEDKTHVQDYFGSMSDLEAIVEQARREAVGEQDSLMLASGGKDSTYALCRMVDLGMRPLVFHLDNGYISEQALDNVRRVAEKLDLELVEGKTPAMDRIFVDSLRRYSNVCNGCFKTIYTMSMTLARERGIRTIITGLSRGQIFETRIADLYRRKIFDPVEIDRTVIDARKAYHRMDDEVSRSLDVGIFRDDRIFDEIRFVDFYRYCESTLDEMLVYLGERTPWARPSDTGRSTNCRLNEVGIFVHEAERGFHNYGLPYSWDVRLGHKERDAAIRELDDEIDVPAARETLFRLGYRQRSAASSEERRLAAYYSAQGEVGAAELRRFLSSRLPPDSIPSLFIPMDALPLSANGKVDRAQLPQPDGERSIPDRPYISPRSEAEVALAEAWGEVLGIDRVGIDDNYFEMGGDSIQCLHVVAAAVERGWVFKPQQLFENPTIAELVPLLAPVDRAPSSSSVQPASASPTELAEIMEEFGEDRGEEP